MLERLKRKTHTGNAEQSAPVIEKWQVPEQRSVADSSTGNLSPNAEANTGWRPASSLTSDERRLHLRQVLERCTKKLGKSSVTVHTYTSGEHCCVVRGKFYGARGIVRDVDFIHDRVLIDLKSYNKPVWMDPAEIEPE